MWHGSGLPVLLPRNLGLSQLLHRIESRVVVGGLRDGRTDRTGLLGGLKQVRCMYAYVCMRKNIPLPPSTLPSDKLQPTLTELEQH